MLAIKKNLQKYFKSLGYFLFKILYGKINEVINTENSNEIEIHSIKKAKKFSYKIYSIKNARLYTDRVSDTAVIKNNKLLSGPSFQFRNIKNEVINADPHTNLVMLNGTPRTKRKISGKVLSLLTGGGGNENYWHWMFDVLPRIGICEEKINLNNIDFFLLPDNKKKFQAETLETLKIPQNKQISSTKFRHILTDELYVTSHPVVLTDNATKDIQNIPEWILEWLKSKFVKNQDKNFKTFSKKVYLDRSDSKSNARNLRSIINEKDVQDFMKNNGFKIVKLSELSFEEQVMTFRNADTIVGLHGAGYANLVFCTPSTKIVEIKANPNDIVIKSLANKNNLTYESISCKPEEIKSDNQFGHINVPIEKLKNILGSKI